MTAREDAITALDAYQRDFAAWEASKPQTELCRKLRAIGEDLATAGVRDGFALSVPAAVFDVLAIEVEHIGRIPRHGAPRPYPTSPEPVAIQIETACGAIVLYRS